MLSPNPNLNSPTKHIVGIVAVGPMSAYRSGQRLVSIPERNGCNKGGSEAERIIHIELKTEGRRKTYAVEMKCVYMLRQKHAAEMRHRCNCKRAFSLHAAWNTSDTARRVAKK
jgi:hypothetical protein